MNWEPRELEGWTLVGYGIHRVDHWPEGIDYFMAMIEQTLGRLRRAGVGCTEEDWKQVLAGVDGIETRGLSLHNWSSCTHQLFDHLPDTKCATETVPGPGPVSWAGIAVYARTGTESHLLELLEQFSMRFRAWADEVLADGRAETEERVRQFLARKHGVDPEMFTFWPDQLPEYDGASSLEVFAIGLDQEHGCDEAEGSQADASC